MSANIRHLRARIAGLSRDREPDDPELVNARIQFAESKLVAVIADTLEKSPPLTDEGRDRIIALLSPQEQAAAGTQGQG